MSNKTNVLDPSLNPIALDVPRSSWRLSSKLTPLRIVTLLFIVLPLLAYMGEGAYRYKQMHAESKLRLDRALRVVREHALKVLETNVILLDRVQDAAGSDDSAALRNRAKALHDQLGEFSRVKPQAGIIWIWDADGQPVVSDRIFPVPAGLNISDRDYFRWPRDNQGGLYLSELAHGRAAGQPFFALSRARYSSDGRFSGVVSINLSPTEFQNFQKVLVDDEPGMAITMVRDDGAILTRWPSVSNQPSRLPTDHPFLRLVRAGEQSGYANSVSSIDSRDRLLAFSKVGNFPVYIGAGIAVDQINQRWMREMGWLAALGLPPMLGLFLALRLVLRRTREALSAVEHLKAETLNRKRVEDALLQAQKMEALGRLTGGVAHDFNNALMVISTNLYLLKHKNPAIDDKQVQAIDRSVETAAKLTRQLLAFSRRQPLMPECLNLQGWFSNVQDLLGPVLGAQVQLSVSVEDGISAVWLDSAELELALINLAINAKDAMPSGGQLNIVARNAGADMAPGLNGNMVLIEVSDTGTGIEAGLLEKVFEPFFTTKPVGKGTGLGLSQIYGLCERAGGTATIESELGVGTIVRLFFPAFDNKSQSRDKPSKPKPRNLAINVLLVEDNNDVAAALRPALEAMGCEIKHLDRATAAQDWLAHQPTWPDVLLSDVVMPGEIDGLGLAIHVRKVLPGLPIVLMSGYAEQLEAITQLGFEIIPKPSSPELIADTIERAIANPQHAQ